MSFIAKNPISSAKLTSPPPPPPTGARGLFPKGDGWYDITEGGTARKLAFNDDLEEKFAQAETDIDAVEASLNTSIANVESNLNESIDEVETTMSNMESSFNNSIGTIQAAVSALDDVKVDKITGKGLSANDYTDADKNKVENMLTSDDVLSKSNTSAFTPSGSYQPATKKYVDDIVNNFVAGTAFGGAYIGGDEMIETLPLLGALFITTEQA